jgi:hypothetical protein
MTAIEAALDDGLELDPSVYGTEFDIDDLVYFDTQTKTQAAREAIGSGALSPNEVRFKTYGLGPVPGGDTPYMQAQMWPLPQLASRDISPTTPRQAELPKADPLPADDEEEVPA